MALIFNQAVRLYYYLNEEIADPRTENWFLMRTPWPGLCILLTYLVVVFHWLPRHMRKRRPYDLKTVMAAYNALQIAACSYVVYHSLTLGWLRHYSLICHPVDDGNPHGLEFAYKVCYGYFLIKMLDLLDTIFFVLRKKSNHVSFLHVYHHFGMVAVGWGMVKWVPGGHFSLIVPVNCSVHVVMYGYYFITATLSTTDAVAKWKKRVTQIQISQFFLMLCHYITLAVARDCDYPRQPAYIMIPQTLFIIMLFVDYYYKSYVRKENKNK